MKTISLFQRRGEGEGRESNLLGSNFKRRCIKCNCLLQLLLSSTCVPSGTSPRTSPSSMCAAKPREGGEDAPLVFFSLPLSLSLSLSPSRNQKYRMLLFSLFLGRPKGFFYLPFLPLWGPVKTIRGTINCGLSTEHQTY